ncbi:MAG TPA: AMP-binding protein, partial [Acidimicrobiia bacterium]|nr:AMP-binding protein [Acidimicrobiia bacterium]
MGESLAPLLDAPALPEELVFFEGRWTTRETLRVGALRLTRRLRDAGVKAGAPVASLVPTSPSAIAAMFGVWGAGGALVPLNPRLTAAERAKVMDEVGPAAVVDHRADDLLVVDIPEHRRTVDPDVALVLYTSGTTGAPKPVMLRHRSILAGIDAVLDTLGSRERRAPASPTKERRPNLVPFSLNLWSGLYNVCFSLRVGAPIVLMRRFDPLQFADLVQRFEIKSSVLAPGMLAMLLDDPAVTDLAPLRFVRNATAPLSPERARAFRERFGVVVLNGYGQSELGG